MDVKAIIVEWLKGTGYNGMRNTKEGCSCKLDQIEKDNLAEECPGFADCVPVMRWGIRKMG